MIKIFKVYLKDYKKQVFLGPAFKLIEAIFELIIPVIVAKIIDTGIENGDKGYVIKMSLLMVLLGAVGLCSTLVCQYYASRASQGFGTNIRNSLFSHINKLSFGQLDRLGSSELITRITNDTEQLQTAVAMLIRLVVRAPFIVIGSTIMAMFIDFKLATIFVVAGILIAVILYVIMSKTASMYLAAQKALDKIALITRENLTGSRVVRAFSKQKYESKRFFAASEDFTNISIRIGRISALLNPLTFLVVNLAIIAILWGGGNRVYSGEMTTGEIIAFVNYMTMIQTALVVVANLVIIFTKASASAKRVNEVFDIVPEEVTPVLEESNVNLDNLAVELKNVEFYYGDAGDKALENISFEIKKGETVGIIGGTASGKTTLINIIAGFYGCTDGDVLINGKSIRNIDKNTLRKTVSVAQQKSRLFSGTVRDNLSMCKDEVSDSQLENALEIAQAMDFVSQKGGLDAEIVQGGKNLSGGQKQRLSVARAIAVNPDVLILDDSMSALDMATESALREALINNLDNLTLIVVSQRIASVKFAEKIIVLDDGKIAGIGNHNELLNTCDEYREIYSSQTDGEQKGEIEV